MIKFPFTITDKGISLFVEGVPKVFATEHPSFDGIKEAIEAGDHDAVLALVDIRGTAFTMSLGRVQILDNSITVDGRPCSGRLVDRILEMTSRGSAAIEGYVKFLDKLMLNPSSTAVKELYLFIEGCNLPITPDGNFLAYKRVRSDYTDIHSGNYDNSIGSTPTMERNEVDDNRDNTCSAGLHFCSYDYLPHFGAGPGNKVVVVEVNPADVVSIPSDYNNAKGRTWTYKVVDEIADWEGDRITPWFSDVNGDDTCGDSFFDPVGFDENGFDENGHKAYFSGFDKDGVDFSGFDKDGYNADGLDKAGLDRRGYDEDGYNEAGFDEDGYNEAGFDEDGYDAEGYDSNGYDGDGIASRVGYNPKGKPVSTPDAVSTPSTKGKLSPKDVKNIRKLLAHVEKGETTMTAIAKQYDVHRETIARIRDGRSWGEVK